jgi:hypothetical protein
MYSIQFATLLCSMPGAIVGKCKESTVIQAASGDFCSREEE